MADHSNIPILTYVLDALGVFGVIVGGYVASKSTYAKETAKDAGSLIDTQRKRIDSLVEDLETERTERGKLQKQLHTMTGELNAYKRLAYIEPEVISKLSTTLDAILSALTTDGLHIGTQNVDTQIVNGKVSK